MLKIRTPHSLQQWHVHVYSSRLGLHILYNNGMYMYIAQDYDSTFELYTCTFYCCKECGVVILSYIHVHAIAVKNVES
jgi:hypothetical protein